MAILKEDGSLDIERINQLPIEEYMEEVGSFTDEQREEYYSKSALFESKEPVRPVIVDYTLEEDMERNGTILLKDKINMLKGKLGKRDETL